MKPRARDLGVPFDGTPGAFNAITDVAGVTVGHVTLHSGDGAHAVRTGITSVFPRGNANHDRVFAATYSLNGNGEMTGALWVEESGHLGTPVLITNTHSVGVVRDAVVEWGIGIEPFQVDERQTKVAVLALATSTARFFYAKRYVPSIHREKY